MMKYASINELKVGLNFDGDIIPVGRLALRDYRIYFEYDQNFIGRGLEISPLKLPLEAGLQVFVTVLLRVYLVFLMTAFRDGWGRLLFDRYVRSLHLLPQEFTPLDRLTHIGSTGLGALVYEPDHSEVNKQIEEINLDLLSQQTQEILDGDAEDVLKVLINLNGSSAGARPKALIGFNKVMNRIISGKHNLPENYEHWIVKFANSSDGVDAGAIEYVYALMAKEAGVEMMPVNLFGSLKRCGIFCNKAF